MPFAFTIAETHRLKEALDKGPEFAALIWDARKDDGLVALRWSLREQRLVGVYDGREGSGGVEDDLRWYTLCLLPGEKHGGLVYHRTRKTAEDWASHPQDYCEGCRDGMPWRDEQ